MVEEAMMRVAKVKEEEEEADLRRPSRVVVPVLHSRRRWEATTTTPWRHPRRLSHLESALEAPLEEVEEEPAAESNLSQ